MKNIGCVSASVLLALAVASFPANAACRPEICVNEHEFVSAEIRKSDGTSLRYSACNYSESASSFRWSGAGFGVFSPYELSPNDCAYKQGFTRQDNISEGRRNVSFQGQPSGRVPTHYLTGWGNYIYSEVTAYVVGEDGRASVDTIEAYFTVSGDKVDVSVSFAGNIDAAVVSFLDVPPLDFTIISDGVEDGTLSEFVEISEDLSESGIANESSFSFEFRNRGTAENRFATVSVFSSNVNDLRPILIGVIDGSPVIFDRVIE